MQTLFDSGQFAPADRTEAFQAVMSQASGLVHRIRFLTEEPPCHRARMSGNQLDRDVLFMHEVSTGIAHERTTQHLRRTGPERIAFVLADGGHGYYEHDGASRPLRRGDLYVTDLNATYSYYRRGTGGANIIQIERSRLEVSAETIRRADQRLANSPLYGLVRDHLASLSKQAALLITDQARAAAAEATVTLLKGLVTSASQGDPRYHPAVQDHLMDRILLYLRIHATDPDLSVTEIAAAHAISTRKLFQLWQSQPLSLSETIMQLRMESAQRRLISQPNLTIAAVARACGFIDASHFSRRFRSVLGCTPTDWRAQHRDDPPGRRRE